MDGKVLNYCVYSQNYYILMIKRLVMKNKTIKMSLNMSINK